MIPTLRELERLNLPARSVLHERTQIPLLAPEASDILVLLDYVDRRRSRAQQEAHRLSEALTVERREASARHRDERKALARRVGGLATEPASAGLADVRQIWTTEIGPQVDRRIKDSEIFSKSDPTPGWKKEYTARGMHFTDDEVPHRVDLLDDYVESAGKIRIEMLRLESEAAHIEDLRRRESEGFDIYEIEAKQRRFEADYFGPGAVVDDAYDWPLIPHGVAHRLHQHGMLDEPSDGKGAA